MNLNDLKQPFSPDDIEFRAGATNNEKTRALALPYIDARAVLDRLDSVCGPENWRDEYQPGPAGGVICGLSIRINNEWVTKWDGAENTDYEPIKGGLSDALKRAGVKWGIARDLYSLPKVWVSCEAKGKAIVLDENEARAKMFGGGQRQAPAQPAPRSNGQPAKGKVGAGPSTAFWTTANKMNLPKEKGQAILAEAGGDFAVALERLNGKGAA